MYKENRCEIGMASKETRYKYYTAGQHQITQQIALYVSEIQFQGVFICNLSVLRISTVSHKWEHPSHFGNQFSISFKGQILSTCGASSSRRWRSPMCLTSSSSVMSLWRNRRGRWITVVPLKNIDTLDTVLTCSLRVYSFLLPVIWKIMVICWVIFRGQ